MKVYTLWHYDYEQTTMFGVWSTLGGAIAEFERHRAASPMLRESYWKQHGIEVHELDNPEVEIEAIDPVDWVKDQAILSGKGRVTP